MDVQKIDLPIVTPDGTHLDPKKLTKEQWEQIPPEVRGEFPPSINLPDTKLFTDTDNQLLLVYPTSSQSEIKPP